MFYFREPRFPTKSVMEPIYRDGTLVNPENPWSNPDNPWCLRMPIPTGICNGTTLQWKVELLKHPLRSYSPKVFKTVKVIKKDTVTDVKVDRRCLFAFDLQMDCPTTGLLFSTSQQEGLKCPCCKRTQQQCYPWNQLNIEEPSEKVGTGNQEFITLELEPPQPQPQPQRPKSSSTHSVASSKMTCHLGHNHFIKSDMPLGAPEQIAALESMAGLPTRATCACGRKHYL